VREEGKGKREKTYHRVSRGTAEFTEKRFEKWLERNEKAAQGRSGAALYG